MEKVHSDRQSTPSAVPQRVSTGGQNESLTGLHDWRVTDRIFPPSPDILFLNQLLAL